MRGRCPFSKVKAGDTMSAEISVREKLIGLGCEHLPCYPSRCVSGLERISTAEAVPH